jgi:hypothetical protein
LAATDTLGRVFDCDCYEDSYAIATAIPYAFGGPSLEFIAANKGQDDLDQDRTKASVVNYFCDQYNSVVSPVCCGGEDRDRMQLVIDTEISEDGDGWLINSDDWPDCFSMLVDWGDGVSEGIDATQLPARHTYAEDGNYNICMLFRTLAEDGTVCWEEERCDAVTGTEERSPAVDLTVYPNPTSGMLHLRFPQEYGVPSAKIFSASGQLVKSVDRQERETLSLVGLPSGAYVLHLRFPGGEIARRRVMLTR